MSAHTLNAAGGREPQPQRDAAAADCSALDLSRRPEFRMEHYEGLYLPGLPLKPRDVLIYLPPGFDPTGAVRYPVLYMHDGQNLFESRRELAPSNLGCMWAVDRVATRLVEARLMRAAIIVGICNTADRNDEYTPAYDHTEKSGGKADVYARFVRDGLKPFIDRHYPTDSSPESTALVGSSLAALATMYMGLEHCETFGRLGVMSPAVWWAGKDIVARIGPKANPPAIWLDVGTREGGDDDALSGRTVNNTRELRDHLVLAGWKEGTDLRYLEDPGAGHNEAAWQARLCELFTWLFPP